MYNTTKEDKLVKKVCETSSKKILQSKYFNYSYFVNFSLESQ